MLLGFAVGLKAAESCLVYLLVIHPARGMHSRAAERVHGEIALGALKY